MADAGRHPRGTPGVPRGALLAVASATLTIAAHGMAGGDLPGGVGQLTFTALLTTLFAWAARPLVGRGEVVRLLVVLAATQAAQHMLLTELAGADHGPAPVNGWLMLATHSVAVAATAVLLTRADRALATVVSAIALLVTRLLRHCVPPLGTPAAVGPASAAPSRPGQLLEVLLRRVSARRGPPVHS